MIKTMQPRCSCIHCREACMHKPGWFLPGQISKLANFLKMSNKEIFNKFLGVDWYVGDSSIFVLAPAITDMSAGTEYPAKPFGRCVFFKDNKCSIYPVRPYECIAYIHDDSAEAIRQRHSKIANFWVGKQEIIVSLLKRQPCEAEYDLIDCLLW